MSDDEARDVYDLVEGDRQSGRLSRLAAARGRSTGTYVGSMPSLHRRCAWRFANGQEAVVVPSCTGGPVASTLTVPVIP